MPEQAEAVSPAVPSQQLTSGDYSAMPAGGTRFCNGLHAALGVVIAAGHVSYGMLLSP